MNNNIEWWSSLNHGGLLISPDKITAIFAAELPPLPVWQADKLRRALTAFDGTNERLGALLDFMLQDLSGLPDDEWQKAQGVDARWTLRSFTGALVKPRRVWQGPQGAVLPVFVPEDGASRQFAGRLGVGRSRQLLSRVVEWLRQKQQPLALVTNGRQWRLVHAGQDYEAWCEWDIDLWFVEGLPGPQVTGVAAAAVPRCAGGTRDPRRKRLARRHPGLAQGPGRPVGRAWRAGPPGGGRTHHRVPRCHRAGPASGHRAGLCRPVRGRLAHRDALHHHAVRRSPKPAAGGQPDLPARLQPGRPAAEPGPPGERQGQRTPGPRPQRLAAADGAVRPGLSRLFARGTAGAPVQRRPVRAG